MANGKQVRIVLGGALGKRFNAEWHLYLDNPSVSEAIRAIDANTRGELRRYLSGPAAKRFYKVAIARKDNLIGPEEFRMPTGECTLYILPTVRGAESGGAKIIAGIVLLAAAFVTGGATTGFFATKLGAFLSSTSALMGASLVLGGIVQLLTPVPSFNQGTGDENTRGSNIFQGNTATIAQGGAVALVYGRMMVTPMPISLSFTAVDQNLPNSFAAGEYDVVTDANGIIDYVPRFPLPEDNLPLP